MIECCFLLIYFESRNFLAFNWCSTFTHSLWRVKHWPQSVNPSWGDTSTSYQSQTVATHKRYNNFLNVLYNLYRPTTLSVISNISKAVCVVLLSLQGSRIAWRRQRACQRQHDTVVIQTMDFPSDNITTYSHVPPVNFNFITWSLKSNNILLTSVQRIYLFVLNVYTFISDTCFHLSN